MEIIGAPTLDDALGALTVRIAQAEERGEKNFIFCEDRLTLLTERAVLAATDGATCLTEVSTFARFLSDERRVLSKEGSIVALSAIMQEKASLLTCFQETQAAAVYETIAQLLSSRVDGALLRQSASESEGTLQRKLNDLALLLDEYGALLKSKNLVDENGYLALLPEKLSAGALRDTNVFFFAFPSFTAQAREGVRAAAENALSVTGIFLAGREEFYTNEGARVFKEVLSEYGQTKSLMAKSSLSGDALTLAKALFAPEKMTAAGIKSSHVHYMPCSDEAEEANAVCALIKKHVLGGARYCDIAVLADGSDTLVWEKAFSQYKIPYFVDRKRSFATHPFCKFLLSVLEGASDGGLPDTVDAVLSSYYFGDGDDYRNYLLKYGCWRGAYKREIREGEAVKRYDREALCACRERLISVLSLFPRKGKGAAFLQGVRALRAFVCEEDKTKALSQSFADAERSFLKLTPLEGVLDEIEYLAGERLFTAREFSALLENGLKALSVSMIPQCKDAVFLGDITESKLTRAKILFCASLTDALPRVTSDTAVIDDGEISRLKTLSVEVEPAIAVVNARARESLALNLVSFGEELYLSYPQKKGGVEQNPSEVLSYCASAFRLVPERDVFPYNCSEEAPAALTLYTVKDDFEAGRENDERKFGALCAALLREPEQENGRAAVEKAGRLWFSGDISPTLLERYFCCPYQSFAERALRLRQREEGAIPDTDAGTFVHAVLEEVAKELNALSDEQACRARAGAIARELLRTPKYAQLDDTGEGRYAGSRLISECAEAAAATYRHLAGSSFRVRATEEKVVLNELSLRGTTDRVDEAEGYVRVIDYKTGAVDDKPISYYTGRKLQLQLYLLAAAGEHTPAGAFYFPAQESYSKAGEVKYRMQGYFSAEDEVMALMDNTREEGKKSEFFEGGGRTEKGMKQEDFNDFLAYSRLVALQAEREMLAGNIAPSPYDGVCPHCRYKGMCAFVGTPRKESGGSCAEIVSIVRRERGEE